MFIEGVYLHSLYLVAVVSILTNKRSPFQTGRMKNLNVDFSAYLADLKEIYELYNPVDELLEAKLLLDAKNSEEVDDAPSLDDVDEIVAGNKSRLDDIWKFLGFR